jgi:hypothetical protein
VAVGSKQEVVSVDRLKPHAGEDPERPAVPPRRGRPPTAAASSAARRLVGGSVAASNPGEE